MADRPRMIGQCRGAAQETHAPRMGFAKPKFWPFSLESVLIFCFLVLVGLGVWAALKARTPAAIARARLDQAGICHAMAVYYQHGAGFTNEKSITAREVYIALVEGETVFLDPLPAWQDAKAFVDPWGSPYEVRIEQGRGGEKTIWVRSKGPDGQSSRGGGDDVVTDLVLPLSTSAPK